MNGLNDVPPPAVFWGEEDDDFSFDEKLQLLLVGLSVTQVSSVIGISNTPLGDGSLVFNPSLLNASCNSVSGFCWIFCNSSPIIHTRKKIKLRKKKWIKFQKTEHPCFLLTIYDHANACIKYARNWSCKC